MICPFCEAHKPCLADESQVRCGLCARAVEGALPWAAGACPAWRSGRTRVRGISHRDAQLPGGKPYSEVQVFVPNSLLTSANTNLQELGLPDARQLSETEWTPGATYETRY